MEYISIHIQFIKNDARETDKPPDPNKAVATPDTYRTTFGSMRKNWKSPKSTFTSGKEFQKPNKINQ